jgi:hypothetical protein
MGTMPMETDKVMKPAKSNDEAVAATAQLQPQCKTQSVLVLRSALPFGIG